MPHHHAILPCFCTTMIHPIIRNFVPNRRILSQLIIFIPDFKQNVSYFVLSFTNVKYPSTYTMAVLPGYIRGGGIELKANSSKKVESVEFPGVFHNNRNSTLLNPVSSNSCFYKTKMEFKPLIYWTLKKHKGKYHAQKNKKYQRQNISSPKFSYICESILN